MPGFLNVSVNSLRAACRAATLLAACGAGQSVAATPASATTHTAATPAVAQQAPAAAATEASSDAAVTERAVLAARARADGLADDPQTAALLREAADSVLAQAERDHLLLQGTVSQAEIAQRFAARPGDFDEFRLSHLFVAEHPDSATQRHPLTQAQALQRAQMLRGRVQAGADFGRLASDESDDGATASDGGQLSSMFGLYLATPFAMPVRALAVGEVSAPVRGPGGYHLIRLEEKHTATLDNVAGMIEAQLREERRDQAIAQLLHERSAVASGITALSPPQRPADAGEQHAQQ